MKKKRKDILLNRLSHSLEMFYPDQDRHFVCPTCLRRIPLTDRHEISEAHIVPKAAGGKLVTLLCRACNSSFGGLQDKWFGEFLRLSNAKASLWHTRHQKGFFSLGDQRVGGKFCVTPEGNFEFYIYDNKTEPAALEAIKHQAAKGSLQLRVPFPLLENKELIKFGALTSAYLL